MKKHVYAVGIAAILLHAGPAVAAEKSIVLKVEGMTCVSCPYLVKSSLTKLDGVKQVKVSLETRLAQVTYDDAKTTVEDMTDATFEAGFPSELKVKVEGKSTDTSAEAVPQTAVPRGSN